MALAYPLPLINDIVTLLGKATCFCTLDLRLAYWQVTLDKSDKKKTTFLCHARLFQFRVMAIGLTRAPGVFQQQCQSVWRDWNSSRLPIWITYRFSLAMSVNIFNTYRLY